MGKSCFIAIFHWTYLAFCRYSRERKSLSYSRRNTVCHKMNGIALRGNNPFHLFSFCLPIEQGSALVEFFSSFRSRKGVILQGGQTEVENYLPLKNGRKSMHLP